MQKLFSVLMVMCLLFSGAALASTAPLNYLIVAKAGAGGVVTGKIPEIGLVLAVSDNPDFLALVGADARVQEAAEDIEVPWINNEQNVAAVESDLTAAGVNSEPYWGYQWNIRRIFADLTAAGGDLGWGVKRARVVVLDAGIWTGHPDIGPNVNAALSRSFVPGTTAPMSRASSPRPSTTGGSRASPPWPRSSPSKCFAATPAAERFPG